MNGLLREIEWTARFKRTHPRATLPISVPKLARLIAQWYPRRYETVLQFALEEFTVQGEEHEFRWKYVPQEWALDHLLGIDYLYRDSNGDLIGLDLTLNEASIVSKCRKHYSLKGIFDHLEITPYVLPIGQTYENDYADINDPTREAHTSYV